MQQAMHNSIELLRVERRLLDDELEYHYLVADERIRNPRPAFGSKLITTLRSLITLRPMLTQSRGI